MAIDIEWVRENPEEAARQIDLLSAECEQYRIRESTQMALRKKAYDERDALAAYQDDLVRELTACQAVLHNIVHDGQVTADYANDAKSVLKRKPTASLALRDAMMRVEGARIVAARAWERQNFLNLGKSERERAANHATLIANELFQESKWGA